MIKKIKFKIKNTSVTVKSGIVYTISQLLTRGLAIITVPIFTRIMTSDDIGVVNLYNSWYSMLSVIATLSLASGGFQLAMKEYSDRRNKYESSVLTITSLMSLIFLIIYLICPNFWQKTMGLSNGLIILMIIGFLVAPARDFWMARQRYEYKYKLSGFLSILTALTASILSILVVIYFTKRNYMNIAESRLYSNYLIVYGISAVLWIYIILKGKVFFDKEIWKYSLGISAPLVGYSIAKQILDVSDRLMISKMIGNSAVGIYSILYSVSSISLIAWNAINASFVPYLFQNINNRKEHNNIKKTSILLLLLYSCIAILMTYFAPEIIRVLATDEYFQAIYIMPPIAAGVYLTSVSNMYSNILIYYKKTTAIMTSSIISAIINLILNYIFIKKLGYQAAAYTTLVAYIILAVLQGIYANKIIKKHTNCVNNLYSNNKIILLSIITIVLSLLGIILYKQTILRYIFISILITILSIIGINKYKNSRNEKIKE